MACTGASKEIDNLKAQLALVSSLRAKIRKVNAANARELFGGNSATNAAKGESMSLGGSQTMTPLRLQMAMKHFHGGPKVTKVRTRRKPEELKLEERWNCPYGCGKYFKKTSSRSIQKHTVECPHRTTAITAHPKAKKGGGSTTPLCDRLPKSSRNNYSKYLSRLHHLENIRQKHKAGIVLFSNAYQNKPMSAPQFNSPLYDAPAAGSPFPGGEMAMQAYQQHRAFHFNGHYQSLKRPGNFKKKGTQKKRRKPHELPEKERWYCGYGCGKFYRRTSSRSINEHLQNCKRKTLYFTEQLHEIAKRMNPSMPLSKALTQPMPVAQQQQPPLDQTQSQQRNPQHHHPQNPQQQQQQLQQQQLQQQQLQQQQHAQENRSQQASMNQQQAAAAPPLERQSGSGLTTTTMTIRSHHHPKDEEEVSGTQHQHQAEGAEGATREKKGHCGAEQHHDDGAAAAAGNNSAKVNMCTTASPPLAIRRLVVMERSTSAPALVPMEAEPLPTTPSANADARQQAQAHVPPFSPPSTASSSGDTMPTCASSPQAASSELGSSSHHLNAAIAIAKYHHPAAVAAPESCPWMTIENGQFEANLEMPKIFLGLEDSETVDSKAWLM